jgi:glycosyltransferase involved in cell wall biosynthesis
MGRSRGCQDKRLLLLLPEVFGRAGGIQMFCRALCLAAGRWAQSNDASVTALALNDNVAPDERYIGGFDYYAGAAGVKAKFIWYYLRQVAASRCDWVVFGHVALSPLVTLAKLFNPGVKTCVVTYGIEVWRPLSKAQQRALRQADVVLAISDYTKGQLTRRSGVAPEKIRVVPCALDPHWGAAAPDAGREPAPPILLSVTRLVKEDRYKGIDNVIRSLPEVVCDAGPVEYRVVGRGDDVPRLRALADGVGVGRYVNFMGGLSDAELREQYRLCSVFVLPSREEGFGIVFLEAMAHGKPVVGGAHGGTPSVVKEGETGLLVDSSDVAGIADSITRLLGDEELRRSLGRAGHRRLLDEFTFNKFEQRLTEALLSAV